jgi:acetyl-CoA carboxylase carboxyl transferase subunit alpha
LLKGVFLVLGLLLEFEKPVLELEKKLRELKKFADERNINLDSEIEDLKKRAVELKKSVFGNLTAWEKVQVARHHDRPGMKDYIRFLISDFVEMHGDRLYGDDPAVIGGIGRFQGTPVTVIGHVNGKDTKENVACNFAMAHPEGYRKALRLMKQAEKFKRPVICFVDTPGAYCGIGAEERGQGEAIARCLFEMSRLKTPIITIIVGEGGSGGALAFSASDVILMQEHAIFSVISPEACASILWKDSSRVEEAAQALKLTAKDLLDLEIIDDIIKEPLGGAHSDYKETAEYVRISIEKYLNELKKLSLDELLERRYKKFRSIGEYGYEG